MAENDLSQDAEQTLQQSRIGDLIAAMQPTPKGEKSFREEQDASALLDPAGDRIGQAA
jgi:hypothetical protein